MKSAFVVVLIVSMVTLSVGVAAQGNPRTWSGIRKLQPGVEVAVRTSRNDLHYRSFAGADDSSVTVLDLSAAWLPSNVARVLRRALTEHPDYFPLPDGKKIVLDDGVAVDRAGVVVAGKKLATYEQMVEQIARADIEAGAVFVDGPIRRPIPKWGKALIVVAATLPVWIFPLICATQGCD